MKHLLDLTDFYALPRVQFQISYHVAHKSTGYFFWGRAGWQWALIKLYDI